MITTALPGAGLAVLGLWTASTAYFQFFKSLDPKPGMLPVGIGVVLFALGAAISLTDVTAQKRAAAGQIATDEEPLESDLISLGTITLIILGFSALVGTAGLIIAIAFVALLTSRFLPFDRWYTLCLFVAILSALVFLTFGVALQLPLPFFPKGF